VSRHSAWYLMPLAGQHSEQLDAGMMEGATCASLVVAVVAGVDVVLAVSAADIVTVFDLEEPIHYVAEFEHAVA
jgi:hypothetical protein